MIFTVATSIHIESRGRPPYWILPGPLRYTPTCSPSGRGPEWPPCKVGKQMVGLCLLVYRGTCPMSMFKKYQCCLSLWLTFFPCHMSFQNNYHVTSFLTAYRKVPTYLPIAKCQKREPCCCDGFKGCSKQY